MGKNSLPTCMSYMAALSIAFPNTALSFLMATSVFHVHRDGYLDSSANLFFNGVVTRQQ